MRLRLSPSLLSLCTCAIGAAALVIFPPAAGAATIHGQAKLVGPIPSPRPVPVTKDQDYCGRTLADESYVTGLGQALKNVVVSIENPPASSVLSPEAKENPLDNNGCRFSPRVVAMRLGERLVIKNSDPKLHIVHSYLEKRTVFNVALPFRGTRLDVTYKIKGPGLLQVNCDTHGWMRGYIHVFAHPFFAVTDEAGAFSIGNLPPGKYTLRAWHEKAGIRTAEVEVSEGAEARVYFEFTPRGRGAGEP